MNVEWWSHKERGVQGTQTTARPGLIPPPSELFESGLFTLTVRVTVPEPTDPLGV